MDNLVNVISCDLSLLDFELPVLKADLWRIACINLVLDAPAFVKAKIDARLQRRSHPVRVVTDGQHYLVIRSSSLRLRANGRGLRLLRERQNGQKKNQQRGKRDMLHASPENSLGINEHLQNGRERKI